MRKGGAAMRRVALGLLGLALAVLAACPAQAVPVSRNATLSLSTSTPITGGSFGFQAPATVSVDEATGSLVVPPGVFGGVTVFIPNSSTTSPSSISIVNLDVQGGTFRPGGITTQLPGELCPSALPTGVPLACNHGGGLGGGMALAGTWNINVLPALGITVPVPLSPYFGGGGSTSSATPFSLNIDGGGWTIGRAFAGTPGATTFPQFSSSVGGTLAVGASRFSLVAPTYVGTSVYGQIAPRGFRPWRLQISFTDGLGVPQFIVDAFDSDGDGVVSGSDNCPDDPNPGQADADGDGVGDVCDVQCDNGLDDDGDGLVDFPDDPGCPAASFDDEDPPCGNGADDDGDGLVDLDDPGCANVAWPTESPACDDGADNDGDGNADHPADDGCAAPSALSEEPECNDALDNDGDGAVDVADPGCRDAAWETESPQCNDGVNNDESQDGLIDFDGGAAAGLPPAEQTAPDPQCATSWDRNEWPETGCGLGGEAALALLGLGALRSRRRWTRRRP
jgi:hypothetical protein